jgi:hypothetical protein
MQNLVGKLKDQFLAKWVVCKLISDKQSVRYGIRLSYPIYILIVIVGVMLVNPYILSTAALIAFLGIKLPLHPFDYVYNYAAKLIGINQIPGRGSELQVNSTVALVFNLVVIALIAFGISINFGALAIIYALSSIFFIGIFLFKD